MAADQFHHTEGRYPGSIDEIDASGDTTAQVSSSRRRSRRKRFIVLILNTYIWISL
jgi:hypothetical protein